MVPKSGLYTDLPCLLRRPCSGSKSSSAGFVRFLLVLCGMCEVGMYRYGVCKTIISVVIDEIKTISIHHRRFKMFTVIIFTASFFRRFNFLGLLSLKVIIIIIIIISLIYISYIHMVGKAVEIKSIPFSRLLSYYWKRRVSTTTLQRENALFILNTSATILSSTCRYNPADGANCEDALLESVHHEE